MSEYPRARISTTMGDMVVELWNDVAPGHVENFTKLAGNEFYDNLIFHRIIPQFVIQGGCPEGAVLVDLQQMHARPLNAHSDLANILKPLGLYNRRAKSLRKMSEGYVGGFKSVDDLYGIGQYAKDSWEIFQNNNMNVNPTDKVLQEYLRVVNE